jgi:hypothetical protein
MVVNKLGSEVTVDIAALLSLNESTTLFFLAPSEVEAFIWIKRRPALPDQVD